MEVKNDSKQAYKIAAFNEVREDLGKKIEAIKSQIQFRQGISAGYKAAAENLIAQQRNFQVYVDDEKNNVDLSAAKLVIGQLNQSINILSKNARQQELEAARLSGRMKSVEDQIESTKLMIIKQENKTKQAEQRTEKRNAKVKNLREMRDPNYKKAAATTKSKKKTPK